jgi:signal peptidase II
VKISFQVFKFSDLLYRYPVNKNKQNISVSVLAGVLLLTLDIVTKLLVTSGSYKPMVFIKNFFYLVPPQGNSGIAFGISIPMWIQIVGSVMILFILFKIAKDIVFKKDAHLFLKPILFGIIIGGAIGNLINRIFLGYVIDFIVLKPIPVFNIADAGVTIGLIGLFITALIPTKK